MQLLSEIIANTEPLQVPQRPEEILQVNRYPLA